MDQEEAPPPYSAVDPLVPPANNRNNTPQRTSAPSRGNAAESQGAGSSRIAELPPPTSPAIVPIHFTSAVAYFEERPPLILDDSRSILHHHMTIYPRSQAKDFPRRPRCWTSRKNEISQQDWDTFLRYLFPPELGLAASSQHLPRQLRAEIQRDRKDRPQETDEQRRARIMAVVDEWNQCFFEPRATNIAFVYIGEPDAASSSALCPHCYPAATKATQGNGASASTASPEGQSPWSSNTSSPVPGQYAQSQSPTSWPYAPAAPYGLPPGTMQYGSPYGVPPFPGHGYPPPHPPPGVPPWQWNNWAYSQPQNGNSSTSKGAFGWFSNITAQAQKYGERFAEQAQHYGDQISAQAMHYGRQVEEQAMAHGRWVEEQARFGRKPDAYQPTGYPPQSTWPPGQTNGTLYNTPTPPTQPSSAELAAQPSTIEVPAQPAVIAATTTQNQNQSHSQPQIQTQTGNQGQNQSQSQNQNRSQDDAKDIPPAEKTRRLSTSSASSESSLSSLDSLSTTSDLDASDLATVRTQLQSLDDRHDRTLYDAAADLRRQLDVLQASRREARFSGRQIWRPGTKNQNQQIPKPDNSDWGRWDSPEQQQRQAAERRAFKEEHRATKKAFREVVRRAREEHHSLRRVHKNHRRHGHGHGHDHGRHHWSMDSMKKKDQGALTGRMENLALNGSHQAPLRAQTAPVVQTSSPASGIPPMRVDTSSGANTPGSNTHSSSQSSMHGFLNELPDRKGKSAPQTRLRDKLKPRISKKAQQSDPAQASREEESDKKSSSKKKAKE
ncbi:hypothetical protein N7507_006551 [Penicillium longicatenatum]|nr:hypothetical protein N7507_006551 [Penicillium longicatenatum]